MKAKGPNTEQGTLSFVGAGPGDAGLLTVRGAELLRMAQVVVVDHDVADDVVTRFTADEVVVHRADDAAVLGDPLARIVLACAAAVSGKRVVRLLSGDGTMFVGLAEELQHCVAAGIRYEVVPGVSLASSAMHAGIALTPAMLGTVHVLDVGRPRDAWEAAVDPDSTVVLLGSTADVISGADRIMAAGAAPDTSVALMTRGTTVAQRSVVATLGTLRKAMRGVNLGAQPTMAVMGPGVHLRDEVEWFEARPLFGWKVLVPTTREDVGELVERIEDYGGRVTTVPTISVGAPRTPLRLDRAIHAAVTGEYAWIGFTSIHAVRAVREKFVEYGLDARALAGVKIAAMAGHTAAALRAWGIEPDLVAPEASVAALLAQWPEYEQGRPPINGVLLPSAEISVDALSHGLVEKGWVPEDVCAYRSMRAAPPAPEIRDAIKRGGFDAVLFQSSACVRNLLGIAGKPPPRSVIASIGPATSAEAESHGLRVDIEAARADAGSVVDALARYAIARRAMAIDLGLVPLRPSEGRRAFTPDVRGALVAGGTSGLS